MGKNSKPSTILNAVIIAVFAAWAIVLGYYLAHERLPGRKRLLPPRPGVTSGPERDEPAPEREKWDKERWVGVYEGRTKIGYAFSRLREEEEGFQLWGKSRLRLKLMDQAQFINLDLQARLDPDYSLREINVELLTSFSLRLHGRREGNNLVLVMNTGGEEVTQTLHFEKPPTLEYEWLLAEELKKTGPGEEFSFSIFEPLSQSELVVRVRVVGEETIEVSGKQLSCWKAELTLRDQVQWLWADKESGEVVKEYFPSTGLTFIREEKEEALAVDWEQAGEVDLLLSLMVPSNLQLPRPRSLTYLRARLKNVSLEGLEASLPGRQTLAGNTVEVTVETALPGEGYALPLTASLPEQAQELASWLAPTPFIQSDHPRLQAAAKEALAGAADAVTAVDRLLAWVSKNVKDSMVVSVPSALSVLEQKQGACKEHTVLFVALARAAGLPARQAAGLVYSDQMMLDGFYYHAWAEVYLADAEGRGGWVAVDPTFNQNPADATHIRLVEGGLEEMIALLQVMGRMEIAVEEFQ